MKIILASKSPRRKELLSQIGLEFECVVSDKEEVISSSIPKDVVEELSLQKAEDVFDIVNVDSKEDVLIIGADTVVSHMGRIMGKPKDKADACDMLSQLNNQCHEVWTGVTMVSFINGEKKTETFSEVTKVYMFDMSEMEIRQYVESGEPMDKAGAYAIQGLCAKFIEKIEGDYNNVVGLPISSVYKKIKTMIY